MKLGGSLITNKSGQGRPRFRAAATRRLARELRGVGPLVLVHGAGSWGHPLALKHRIGTTRLSGAKLVDAVTRTQASVAKLRALVSEACVAAGLPVVEVPAHAVAVTRRGDTAFDAALFSFYASKGLVPLTSGDVILDDRRGARVLSGDEILTILARALNATRVIFASDVDGVFRDGRRVPRLSVDEARRLPTKNVGDATGGMGGKLREAAAIAASGVRVFITNGAVAGRLRAAALGSRRIGTLIA